MAQLGRERTRRWTRAEYDRLIEQGFFDEDEPIELLDGMLLVKEPQGTRHIAAVLLVSDALRAAFGRRWTVRIQMAIALDGRSEPEPDIAVVRGTIRDYRDVLPSRPALLVEVAHSGLRIARGRKAIAYARGGIADYWIVNLVDRVLEVHRNPISGKEARGGPHYRSVHVVRPGGSVSPLAKPSTRIAVAELLP